VGPDSLELVRLIENEFSIYLPDDELNEVFTVGNLHELLVRKLKATPGCLTSKAFYRLRKAITGVLDLPRRSVRPATFLDDIFDEKHIREQWSSLTQESGLNLPRLRHAATWRLWMQILSAALSATTTITLVRILSRFAWIHLDNFVSFAAFWILGFLLWGFLYSALLKATPFRRSELPVLSAGELARAVLSMNSHEFPQEKNGTSELTSDQVWTRLVGVFCDQLSCKPEEVVPSATIAVDLGVD
jgi:hypothetical protein